ncbi:site-2 protease family protein [Prochlorococcus marinus]|uniref:Zinc metalloprotease n=1 Tax=Prochlorococcus marinus (strain MIT 9211) TaxID=93059 RepID=A9BEG1_PROM4|nr:site-2 protease family protein [Prochlorococcus marinus]ABX08471.1 Zn-dependent protease [Prochlorococcus marinus str. MIT 9211]
MRIRGIPIRVHPSWFLILFVFTCASQGQISNLFDSELPVLLSWGIGFLTSLLVFASVVLHELGHSFMAMHEGIKVRSITLFLLGGVARIDKECVTAMSCLRVAIAGPLVSLSLAGLLLAFVQVASNTSLIASNLFSQLGTINLLLAFFNLLPGLPLDGGVILKSIVWHFSGSQRKGLKVANYSGRLLSVFAVFLGTFIWLRGGGFGGIWLIILGWFGLASSRSQNQIFSLQEILCTLNVSQASRRNFRVLEVDQSLKSISELNLGSAENQRISEWVLLCNAGRWVGYLTDKVLKDVPVQDWDKYLVSEYSQPLSELPSISDKEPLWHAVLTLEKLKASRLLVFNSAGLPSGTLDKVDIGNAVLSRLGLKLPKSFLETARQNNIYPLGISLVQVVEEMIITGLVQEPNSNESMK